MRYGAEVNNVDEKGITPLNFVCGDKEISADDRVQIVRILIEAGADPNCKDYMEGRTALQVRHTENVSQKKKVNWPACHIILENFKQISI